MKRFMLFVSVSMFCAFLPAQALYRLSGRVLNSDAQALAGAVIALPSEGRYAGSDAQGLFSIDGLAKGVYPLQISLFGYAPLLDTLRIEGDLSYEARLSVLALSLQEVVVTDHYDELRKKKESLSIETLNADYLRQHRSGSLMKTLDRLPGVSSIDIGAGLSKPVIRGLAFNRVAVVENNIKHEAQEWGADHGLEIDQYAVDRVEVIKGPASLMYGSDAIGGVVDMKSESPPQDKTLGGSLELSARSNNDFIGAFAALYARKNSFFANLRASLLNYGDYKVPTDSVDIYSYRAPLYERRLRNTAGKEHNLHLSFGVMGELFQSRFYVSSTNARAGFFANAHGLEPRNVDTRLHDASNRDIQDPRQNVSHLKLINTSHYRLGSTKFESNLGFQRNFRQEWSPYVSHGYMPALFPDSLSFPADLERQFDKTVVSGSLKFFYDDAEKLSIRLGLSGDYQKNRIDGRGFIIPAYGQAGFGTYGFAKYSLSENSLIQAGLRYDFSRIATRAYQDWFPSPVNTDGLTELRYLQRAQAIDRSFSNLSWSLGYNLNRERWSFKGNAGKSFRVPIAKELAANGVNYHHFSYEVGDAALSPEISYQLDGGVDYASKNLAIGLSPFLNYFSNYIYLNPTAEHDRQYGNGNQVYRYAQSRVLRYGGEMHAHYQLFKHLQLGIIAEYVYSEQLSGAKKGFTLPFSPPLSAIFNVKYRRAELACFEQFYFTLDLRMTAAQTLVVPPEEPTAAYQVVDVGLGGNLNWMKQKISFMLQLQNLFDKKYFNHTSYYRLINVPEPGRNLVLSISLPFAGKMK